jgi:hypothetical protein
MRPDGFHMSVFKFVGAGFLCAVAVVAAIALWELAVSVWKKLDGSTIWHCRLLGHKWTVISTIVQRYERDTDGTPFHSPMRLSGVETIYHQQCTRCGDLKQTTLEGSAK